MVGAQEPAEIPRVSINDRSVSLQQSIYPEHYRSYSVAGDMRWVQKNDTTLLFFWEEWGDDILASLQRMGGIPWVEESFDIYLLRFYPVVGEAEPLIIPLGGIKHNALTEAAPAGVGMKFNLIFQLARRLLAQAERPEREIFLNITDHPLMRTGSRRRDNLALLLTVVIAQDIIGIDSTFDTYQSAFWRRHLPGLPIFEKYLLGEWILSETHTLAEWVTAEPQSSQFVRSSRPPRLLRRSVIQRPQQFIEGLPAKGLFGFSVKRNQSNRLVVSEIDPTRVGYASGLREEDIILAVDGRRVKNHRKLIELIYETFEMEGTTLTILRNDRTTYVVLQPLPDLLPDDLYYWDEEQEDWYDEDSPGEEFDYEEDSLNQPE